MGCCSSAPASAPEYPNFTIDESEDPLMATNKNMPNPLPYSERKKHAIDSTEKIVNHGNQVSDAVPLKTTNTLLEVDNKQESDAAHKKQSCSDELPLVKPKTEARFDDQDSRKIETRLKDDNKIPNNPESEVMENGHELKTKEKLFSNQSGSSQVTQSGSSQNGSGVDEDKITASSTSEPNRSPRENIAATNESSKIVIEDKTDMMTKSEPKREDSVQTCQSDVKKQITSGNVGEVIASTARLDETSSRIEQPMNVRAIIKDTGEDIHTPIRRLSMTSPPRFTVRTTSIHRKRISTSELSDMFT